VNEGRIASFTDALRRRGLPVPVSSTIRFAQALEQLDAADAQDIYWAGRVTLVSDPAHIEIYDEIFAAFAGDLPTSAVPSRGADSERGDASGTGDTTVEIGAAPSASRADMSSSIDASSIDILRRKRFDHVTAEESATLIRLIRSLQIATPPRRSRRRSSRAGGRLPDLRATLRLAASAGGEPILPVERARRVMRRPIVLLLDISGSMRTYSRFLLQFGHAAVRSGLPTQVFCFGTRITRVTPAVAALDPDAALDEVANLVPDWEGGTKIGESVGTFLDRWGRKGLARGAVVVICSDGMERGDPADLALQMARLSRIAYQIAWINPLKGDVRYRPTARGMAAALPHIDLFRAGHNVASLEDLARVLGDLSPRTARQPAVVR
jgi:uncharacterized protein with von Willebrand factor type A (vWA) domain